MNALFDLDGTLCDPREGIVHGFRHAFDALGLAFPGEALVVPLIGLPLLNCFERLGLGPRSAEAAQHFQAFFEGRGFAEARLYPGIHDLLSRLQRQGWGLAIASAKPTFAVKFVVEALELFPLIAPEHCFGCAPQDLAPDKAPIVAEALRSLGWEPEETVMIGDRAQDREAAQAQGLRFIGAAWGFGAAEELRGVRIVEDPGSLGVLLDELQ